MATARLLPHWDYLSWARDRFGVLPALWHYPPALRNGIVKVRPGVFLRPATPDDASDQEIYDGVFIRKEYDVDIPEPQLILDAGAHIGLASVWFARRYPKARILALEPDEANFDLLVRNTRGLNVLPLRCGLWSSDTTLRIVNEKAASWSFRAVEDPYGDIEAVSMDFLIRKFGKIDCVKMDIEGSEVAVLSHSRGWIDTVDSLMVELHDKEEGAHACKDALDYAIDGRCFTRSQSGENVVLVRVRD